MPTKKRRVGFIPRISVLEIITKLSFESNLSNSKIVNILVEEALNKRGLFNIETGTIEEENKINKLSDTNESINKIVGKELFNNVNKKKLQSEFVHHEEDGDEFVNSEIYEKFLMFLKFKEIMKKKK